MTHSLESIDLAIRRLPPNRVEFGIGARTNSGDVQKTTQRRPDAVLLVRLQLRVGDKVIVGCSGDRPSFGWLDKRPEKTADEKLSALLDLVEFARTVWLEEGRSFATPFALWQQCYQRILKHARSLNHEDLTASYACALFERATLDAFCKAAEQPFFRWIRSDASGFEPARIHPELAGKSLSEVLAFPPTPRLHIRHTVGLTDPIIASDLDSATRANDGEPETLADYAKRDGLRYFKIKISGSPDHDIARLQRIWHHVLVEVKEPAVTLDGNEAFHDLATFEAFVDRFASEVPGLFDHTLFIEQPLTRALTSDPSTSDALRRIAARKALVIDEADGSLEAFKTAWQMGYSGTSHKNCKGVFKSLLNAMLCDHFEAQSDRTAFLTAEDLSNMPILPLHQDFAVVATLGISHCERNGHHYALGLSHLTPAEKNNVASQYPDLYVQRGDEWFLRIQDGQVRLASLLSQPGLGGTLQPQWESLIPLADWRREIGA